MKLFPAIDLKDGHCVRLRQGDMKQATIFSKTPGAQAAALVDDGAQWLHVVDLNGAFEGRPVNTNSVADIVASVANRAKVQLGGGIRHMAQIEAWLEQGLTRVILGTVAVRDPALVKRACKTFPGRVAVGLDARNGRVAVSGWVEAGNVNVIEMAKMFEGEGVAAIIYTDIDRDGMMKGPNVDATAMLARAIQTPVIASGGVASYQDLDKLIASNAGIVGCIIGRAIYDGAIDFKTALTRIQSGTTSC